MVRGAQVDRLSRPSLQRSTLSSSLIKNPLDEQEEFEQSTGNRKARAKKSSEEVLAPEGVGAIYFCPILHVIPPLTAWSAVHSTTRQIARKAAAFEAYPYRLHFICDDARPRRHH